MLQIINFKVLRIESTAISFLGDSVFSNASHLTYLSLLNNQIEFINEDAFSGLKFLRGLSLENNNIEYMKPNTFSPLTKLEELILSRNGVMIMQENIINFICKLRYVKISLKEIHVIHMSNETYNGNCLDEILTDVVILKKVVREKDSIIDNNLEITIIILQSFLLAFSICGLISLCFVVKILRS